MPRSTQERPLAGKVALVTGGSRGIGAAIAKRLAADGAGHGEREKLMRVKGVFLCGGCS